MHVNRSDGPDSASVRPNGLLGGTTVGPLFQCRAMPGMYKMPHNQRKNRVLFEDWMVVVVIVLLMM